MTLQSKLAQPQLASTPELEVWGLDIEAQRGATWGDWPGKIWFGAAWGREGGVIEYAPPRDVDAFARLLGELRQPGRLWVAHNGRYDLGGVNSWAQRFAFGGPIAPVYLHDTCRTYHDSAWFSKKLADQAWHYDITSKGAVDRYVWEAAYLGEDWALEYVREYNINDVVTVLELRRAKMADGTIRAPKLWTP